METYDLLIRSATVLTPAGRVQTDLGVRGGRIAAIGDLATAKATEVLNAENLTVLPGVIDSQVHFREPGLTHKEDLESGTRAAALGGVVAVFEMPNTKPSITTPDLFNEKVARAKGRCWTDFAFYFGGDGVNAAHLATYERLPACCGVKVFMGSSTGSLLVEDDQTLDRIIASIKRRAAFHCEDEPRLRERKAGIPAGATAAYHPIWRDVETALNATKRLVAIAERHRKAVHALHITSAEELELLRGHKDLVSVECLVNHLTLAAPECYERLGSFAQQNPPVREARHRDALWKAIADGTIDIVATDHAPHTREEKARPYPDTPAGMPGVQTLVPVMLDHVAQGRLSLERFVDLTSAGVARLFNLAGKGRIAVGYDADFTIVDLKARRTISDAQQASKVGWTPFAGMNVTGWPMMTIVRGRVVMRDGELIGSPIGEPVRFRDTMAG
jgi:dihydroorotase